jgi:hypothetical protein
MKIIKFNESVDKEEIDDILYDFKDSGYEIESDIFEGVINITGKINSDIDRIEFLKEVINLNSRIISLGYESINEKLHVYTGTVNNISECKFMLRFKDTESKVNKDVNSFEEFKTYLEKHLDLKFYEWDTEVYIPDLDNNSGYQKSKVLLKLDVDKERDKSFVIFFEKGDLGDINTQYQKELSELIITNDEWSSINLWSIPNDQKEQYSDPELIKRARSKQFKFDKKGIEAVERCLQAFKR